MNQVSVTIQSVPIEVDVRSSEPVALSLVSPNQTIELAASPGPKGSTGDPGPDPWLEPIQDLAVNGDLTINYSLGKHVRLHLLGDITSFTVTNWPAVNRIARLTLEINNTGNFGILAWPTGTLWQSGSEPEITQGEGARDRIILSTTDSGETIYGDPVGFDYR